MIKYIIQATNTDVDEAVDERVIARVAHCQAVAAKPDNIDVSVPVQKQTAY